MRCIGSLHGDGKVHMQQFYVSLLARHDVVSMLVQEPDLEDAFLDLYGAAS